MSTPSLRLLMTDAGRARFTAAQLAGAGAQLAVAEIGLTDAAFTPAPTLTALPGEFRRVATISGKQVGTDTAHLIIRDDDAIAYSVRGIGLFLADGTLFAVYGQPAPILAKSAVSSMMIALDIAFPALGTVALTFGNADWLNPAATESTAGVVEIATAAETAAGTDDRRAVSPKKLATRLADVTTALLAAIADAIGACIPLAQKAAPNGVATLDGAGRVPTAQLPPLPVGSVMLFFGAAVPSGWAICNGQTVARTDGAGNVTTPDLRGRVAVGVSADRALGAAFGATLVETNTATTSTGASLTTSSQTSYAGNGTQQGVKSVELVDPGHRHAVTIDVTQPSLALHYIMKV